MVCAVRYVFLDEASAEASADGRSAEYVVARSGEEAAEQARKRCAAPCFHRSAPLCTCECSNPNALDSCHGCAATRQAFQNTDTLYSQYTMLPNQLPLL